MTTHRKLSLLQIYARTADSNEAEIKNSYNDLQKTLHFTTSRDITIGKSDFSVKLGERKCSSTIGPTTWLGVRNHSNISWNFVRSINLYWQIPFSNYSNDAFIHGSHQLTKTTASSEIKYSTF